MAGRRHDSARNEMKLPALQLTRSLFLFTAVVLVLFGVGSLLRINLNPDRTGLYTFYAFAMFGDAAVMAFCARYLYKGTKSIFYFSVVVLVLNIVLTVFDQFGLADLVFVLLNLITLLLLLLARKEFFPL